MTRHDHQHKILCAFAQTVNELNKAQNIINERMDKRLEEIERRLKNE